MTDLGMTDEAISWRPRRHPRARRIRMVVEQDGELVVTVPRGVSFLEAERFVQRHRSWVREQRARLARQRAGRCPETHGLAPEEVQLAINGERWQVVYTEVEDWELVEDEGLILVPEGEPPEWTAWRLQQWLKDHARSFLEGWVRVLATTYGWQPGKITIRNQRARWGSCSATGNLSLNAQLLYCPAETCRYVLIHELVHLEHFNHSPRFWARVAELCPDYREHKRVLAGITPTLPDWVVWRRRPGA